MSGARGGDGGAWLVSPRFDLWMFLAPAVVALFLVPLGPYLAPRGETPLPMWIVLVLGVDVAHVWATLFRTYLDPVERARRGRLFAIVPVLALVGGAALALHGLATFWTVLAYLAVFHFVRQQYGWVALYHRKDPDLEPLDRQLDVLAIYAGTLYPLLWWHAHLPRTFDWFVPGDFVAGLVSPAWVDPLLVPYLGLWAAYAARQVVRTRAGRPVRPGKWVVVFGTAVCWGVGIVATDSDWAFTVTNVLLHGVPYFGLVFITARPRPVGGVAGFLGVLLGLAVIEEIGWHRLVGGDGAGLFFGAALELPDAAVAVAAAALAVPQVTHYVLDGFIWRRR